MRTKIAKSVTLGLAVAGLLWCGSARAQIAVQDGSLTTAAISDNTNIVSTSFTVTEGASVLVVSLYDRCQAIGESPTSLAWGAQTLTRAVSQNNENSHYADSDIFYLFNPTPGTQTITATDTSGTTPSAMTMQVFTLNGVDTNDMPVTYQAGNADLSGATPPLTLSLTLTNATLAGSWAAVQGSMGDSGGGGFNMTSSSGTLVYDYVVNNQSQIMGAVENLAGGTNNTITENDPTGGGDAPQTAFVAAVFSPLAPTTPPTAPTNVVATPGANQVALSWADTSGGQATSYIVLRSIINGSGYTAIVTNTGNGSTTYTDHSVSGGTTYYYVVQAVDAGGTSPDSSQVSATPTGLPTPTAPTDVVATAQTNQVALSWADSTGGAAASYIVLRSITSGSGYIAIATNAGNASTAYTDLSVSDGTTYYYVVQAVDAGGTSPDSAQASATPFFDLPPGLSGSIKVLDGGTNTIATVANGAGSTISTNFTVSQGASVMVVELWDRNTENNNSSPSFMTWNNTTTSTAQTLTRAVSEVSGASTYSDCDIYYLFNPTPGTGTVTGTDTNAVTIEGLTMMVFDLSGVDTTVNPVTYATNGGSVTTLAVATSAHTPAGAFAAVISYDGNTGNAINNASTSGTSTYLDVLNNQEQAVGYVSGLAGGSSTISMTDSGGATEATLAVAVFAPSVPTGIALHDGSIYSTNETTGAATISEGFTVTQGASVMVVALYDDNNTTTSPGPAFMVWSNNTLGTAQLLTLCEDTNTTGYVWTWADFYYLWDPSPGIGTVSGTDTNSQETNMLMEVYTLGGVDTTVPPFVAGNGNGSANILSVDTSTNTVFGSWAAVMSVQYNGGGGNNVTFTANSGGTNENNFRPDGLQCTMGYITNLGAGDTTITADATGGPSDMDLAAAVFSPLPGTATPINVAAAAQTNQVALSWTDASGGVATAYIVLRSTSSGSGFTAIVTNTGNTSTTYTDTQVIDWTTYYYLVESVGPSGLSLPSTEVSATPMGLPAVPTGLVATAGVNQVVLTWNNQLGASSYTVLRSTTSGSGFLSIGSSTTNDFTDTGVADGTLYYYEINATNSFGKSANSSQASAIPVVAFFTNYIGIFNSTNDTAGWVLINGNTANAQFITPGPPSGPSSGALVLDATYGPGGTDAYQGIATNFPVAINVSTYPSLELDIANEGLFDEYSQIQAIQLNLQLPVAGLPTYEMGTLGSISLNATQNPDGTWTHYVIPMSDWAGYNLTGLTAFAINIYDGDTTTNTELDPAFSNIKFTGAPAWAPVFSGLTSPTIGTNSTSVTLTGTVSATVAGTNLYLANNTVVTVTINGIAQQTTIDDATGNFSINYNTTGLPADVYPVTYKAASDLVALVGATNSSTSLTVIAISVPIINPPYLEGTNLVISVNTQSGHTYYLLSTTNLAPPVVWSTNITTAGTGGTITNSVGISPGQPDEFFKFEVH